MNLGQVRGRPLNPSGGRRRRRLLL